MRLRHPQRSLGAKHAWSKEESRIHSVSTPAAQNEKPAQSIRLARVSLSFGNT
jgi:hypothetical protein